MMLQVLMYMLELCALCRCGGSDVCGVGEGSGKCVLCAPTHPLTTHPHTEHRQDGSV